MPVMIPGSAIGSSRRNDTDSRPKNRKRWIANAAIEPSTSATAVAISPTFTESQNDERTSESCHATENQCVVQPEIGQLWMCDSLNASTAINASGIERNRTTSSAQTVSPIRAAGVAISPLQRLEG